MAIDLVRLRALFRDELEERQRTLQDGLLELERDPAAADRLLPGLFRDAHSLKGGALAVQLPTIASLCHRLEEVLGQLQAGELAPAPQLLGSLLADVDALATHASELGDTPTAGAQTAEPAALSDPSTQAQPAASRVVRPRPVVHERDAVEAARPAMRVPVQRLDNMLDRTAEVLLARDQLVQLVRDTREIAEAVAAEERNGQRTRTRDSVGSVVAPAPPGGGEQRPAGHRSRLEELHGRTSATARTLQDAAAGLDHSLRTLRLQPFAAACDHLERAVREMTRPPQREVQQVELVVDGDVELDGEVVTALRGPLLHLVRNAIAHGIETPEARREAGKPPSGTVTVSAVTLGDQVEVSVVDDGRGIDLAALRARAAEQGIATGSDDAADARLAWLSGLSTAQTTDELAGRGVGLDAVRAEVEQLGGTVELASCPGAGCTVRLRLPVTLTTLHALIVEAGGQTVALPTAAIRRVVRFADEAIQQVGGTAHVMLGDELAAVVSLRQFLGLDLAPARGHHVGVLLAGTRGPAVLLVDKVTAARRITRRQVHPRLQGAPGVLGTTLLASGEVALVLNPMACTRTNHSGASVTADAGTETTARRVLLAEDSATTRALEVDILERAGYEVRVAVDGEEAWELLRAHGADLVVSDVEMPKMDGFELCQTIRNHPQFGQIPVILLTSRAREEDRHRGIEVGANAYLVKGAFDQPTFLTAIGRLL